MLCDSLLSTKPARKITLALCGLVLHCAIEFVNLFERLGLGLLCVGFSLALGFGKVMVDCVYLFGLGVSFRFFFLRSLIS